MLIVRYVRFFYNIFLWMLFESFNYLVGLIIKNNFILDFFMDEVSIKSFYNIYYMWRCIVILK